MAIVVPAPGQLAETARALLDLTSDPREVRTIGNGLEFEVPDELADRYHRADKTPSFSDAPSATEPDSAAAKPVKRRGRAPRVDLEG